MKARSMDMMIKIRDFAEQYYANYGCSPSTTMIAVEIGVSRGTAYKYLVEMAEKGLISYDGGKIVTSLTQNSNADRSNAPIVGTIRCGSPEEERAEIQGYVSLPASIFGYGDFYILKSGVSLSTIQRFRNSPTFKTARNNVLAICIGLQLEPVLQKDLLRKCGIMFSNSPEDILCEMMMCTMYRQPLSLFNQRLQEYGFPPLSKCFDELDE